jgi:hypothetical protein
VRSNSKSPDFFQTNVHTCSVAGSSAHFPNWTIVARSDACVTVNTTKKVKQEASPPIAFP